MENPNNRIVAVGQLEGGLTLSHAIMVEPFYAGTLLVKRLSGVVDRLAITIPGKLLSPAEPEGGARDAPEGLLMVTGQVRSYNKMVAGGGRLMVTLFAQSISPTAENDTMNNVSLTGVLCKPPIYRSTPFGKEICDMMLAVNRAFGRSDYIPCITWGRNAQYASRFHVGDKLRLSGRLQSREYQKKLENGEQLIRSVYEVSAFTVEAVSGEEAAATSAEQPISKPIEPT